MTCVGSRILHLKRHLKMAAENLSNKRERKKSKTVKHSKRHNFKDGSSEDPLGVPSEIAPAQITAKRILDSSKSMQTLLRFDLSHYNWIGLLLFLFSLDIQSLFFSCLNKFL